MVDERITTQAGHVRNLVTVSTPRVGVTGGAPGTDPGPSTADSDRRALGSTAFGCGAEVPELAGADGPGSAPSLAGGHGPPASSRGRAPIGHLARKRRRAGNWRAGRAVT